MSEFEMVIGLETHVELKTRTKIFCACAQAFGDAPNSHICPVCAGLPGALPVLNEQTLFLAVKAGLALSCKINEVSRFDRKNYFYPDLPKAYQISQFYQPLCENGQVVIETAEGEKRVGITRVHMEEDAGKLLHEGGETLIDMNRCGVPLIEIVTEPDIGSASEAVAYLRKLRALLLYAAVSDCRMNEGSLRCDVNLSVRKKGAPLGTRTEMKNLNSFQSVEKAILAEYARQCERLRRGEEVVQETRRYDQKTGKTAPLRRKENSDDYRYFPEPDLPPVIADEALLSRARAELPAMPDERKRSYIVKYGLTPYQAEQIVCARERAEFFERCMGQSLDKSLAGQLCALMMGEAFSLLPEDAAIPLAPADMTELSRMLLAGEINSAVGRRALSAMLESGVSPRAYVTENALFAVRDETVLAAVARETLAENPDLVHSYRAGKTKVFAALMGRCMAKTQGLADAPALERALLAALDG